MALEQDQSRWIGPGTLLDQDDTKLRLRVQALTQLKRTDAQRAVAVYGFVKTLSFRQTPRFVVRSARGVLDDGHGGWFAKSTLFIAMLRLAGIPARLRVLEIDGATLRGLVETRSPFVQPVVEFWINDRWIKTDTHIYDPRTMTALRSALARRGWVRGYGVHRLGQALWDGRDDAFASIALDERDGMPAADFGVYDDVSQFLDYMRRKRPHLWALRLTHFRMIRARLQSGIARLVLSHGAV